MQRWEELEYAREDDIAEGIIEGKIAGKAEEIVEMGQEFGLMEENILERLRSKLDISMEEAEKYFAMFRKQAV